MMYEELLIEADNNGLITKEKALMANKGRIKGNKIAIKQDIPTLKEKACVLAEELGHYYTSTGDILDQQHTENVKQELKARLWAYDRQIGLIGIIEAYKNRCTTIHEIAEFLEITEEFLCEALECYRKKYGVCKKIDAYVIYFEPFLGIVEMLE